MMKQVVVAGLACLGVALGSPSFAGDDEHENAEHGRRRPLTEADAAAGTASYLAECSGCHGEHGNGNGPAAEFIDPRPRDFTRGFFKFRTTASGRPPATADILRIIERGIPGTAMPSFAFLAADERGKIAAYVLKLAALLDEPEPEPLQISGTPPAVTRETVAKGKGIYTDAGCASCHGDLGKGDGRSAKDLKDTSGRPIEVRDLTRDHFRGGSERLDLYYRLATGLDGTPMPSYKDSIAPLDLWALVDYVLSLRVPAVAKRRPADPLAAGRAVAAKYSCHGCHVLDDGRGGDVGPDLRLSGQKLDPQWVRGFLEAPRAYGKLYPCPSARPRLPRWCTCSRPSACWRRRSSPIATAHRWVSSG